MHDTLLLYADGSYQPIDRSGGWAFVVFKGDQQIHSARGTETGLTNNGLEVLAVVNAATWIEAEAVGRDATLFTDSAHVVEGCLHWRSIWRNNGWKRYNPNSRARARAIPDAGLWRQLDDLLLRNPAIRVEWCKGHSSILGNELADALARMK
jgi:ribonuclease HI